MSNTPQTPDFSSLIRISDALLGKEKTDEIMMKVLSKMAAEDLTAGDNANSFGNTIIAAFPLDFPGDEDVGDTSSPTQDAPDPAKFTEPQVGYSAAGIASATITISLNGPREVIGELVSSICTEAEAQIMDAKEGWNGGDQLYTSISTSVHTVQ